MTDSDISIQRAGRASLRWLWLALVVIVLDQVTKWIVVGSFYEFERVFVLPVFDLVRYHNTGVAFSLFADAGEWKDYVLPGVAAAVSAGIIWYQWTLPASGCRTLATGLALVLGGAIGNLIDRINYGYVVDFLLFYYNEWSWPAFNVADSAITVGVALIILDSFLFEPKRRTDS